ncbi:hypothetical protein F2P81_005276 [Scophthalmus maximus]|uniref:Uncharacterized protein n=1 Tax=Scophthalmus maximus TaxID=52904 RepID=A0A6A4TEU4_SCOMX|nr:hypothetical protein F2P81_005276 [Scophthalmus maximus]
MASLNKLQRGPKRFHDTACYTPRRPVLKYRCATNDTSHNLSLCLFRSLTHSYAVDEHDLDFHQNPPTPHPSVRLRDVLGEPSLRTVLTSWLGGRPPSAAT